MDGQPAPIAMDAPLLAATARGDRDAFATLYRRHAPASFGLALRLLGNRAEAEDVVHDVFLKLFDAAGDIRDADRLSAWLKRATANACSDALRARRPLVEPETLDQLASDARADDDCEWPALLATVPHAARPVVWLAVVEGWTHAELADRFGRSESWSKSVLSRALAGLRRQLTPSGERP